MHASWKMQHRCRPCGASCTTQTSSFCVVTGVLQRQLNQNNRQCSQFGQPTTSNAGQLLPSSSILWGREHMSIMSNSTGISERRPCPQQGILPPPWTVISEDLTKTQKANKRGEKLQSNEVLKEGTERIRIGKSQKMQRWPLDASDAHT